MKIERDTLLGLVFFGGLALVGWATVTLTSLSLEPRPTETIYFDRAQGLRVGDPVSVLGKRLGQVLEVGLVETPDKPPIVVTIELERPIALTENARIEIKQTGLLGGQEIAIDPGSSDGPPAARPLRGASRPSAIEALGDADIVGMVDSIKRVFDLMANPDGSIGALLASRDIYDDLATTAQSLRQIMEKVNEGAGLASRVVNDTELAANAAAAVEDVRALTGSARRGDGVLGRLFIDATWADDVGQSLASIRSSTAKIDDPESGLAGALLGDRKLRDDATRIADNVAAATDQVRSGRGLLGRLVFDDELGEQLERVFTQVSGAIEDVREAAPVGTFFQVLATPF